MKTWIDQRTNQGFGMGNWQVDRKDGIAFGPCLVVYPLCDNRFDPISTERAALLCQILWGHSAGSSQFFEALKTTATYLSHGDTLSAKLCLRRLGLLPLTAKQFNRLHYFQALLESGANDWQLTIVCRKLDGRHFDGPHGHIEDVVKKLHQLDVGKMTRKCGAHFREAMESGKFNMKGHPISAKDYADFLSHNPQFEELTPDQYNRGVDPDRYDQRFGDIAVFPAAPGHEDGHIQIWDGTKWFSTTGQPSGWPHRNYKLISGPPYFRVFRVK